jgi:serine/threonine-protein kinase
LADFDETLATDLADTYTIERELGGGGMSRVFVATERKLDRRVVIKILPDNLVAGIDVDRFRREINLAAKLQHPHIVPVLSSGEVRGTPFFTMPYIDGESLRQSLSRSGELPLNNALRILRQVASALAYAHKSGVVHRDIKPENVLLTLEFALVTDFGVAKALDASAVDTLHPENSSLTTAGMAIGTPTYMAPEQGLADPNIDNRADIYSFGVLAYEMLTGSPPFVGRTPQALIAAHAISRPEPIESRRPSLPPALAQLVMRCLEKRPADRPQTATEVLQLLESPELSLPSGHYPSAQVPARKSRNIPVAASVAVAAIAVAIIAYAVLFRARADDSTAAAGIRSLAVLPLVNVGGSSEDEYFSEGMTDEIANALNKLPGLRVASRTSAYAFKSRNADAGEIGRKLKVQSILEGTVRRSGNRLRVTAQLTSVADGFVLWSDTYERPSRDVFDVQDDISRSIADALKVRFASGTSAAAPTSRSTGDLQAYDLYLRGRYFWNLRGADNLRRASSYYADAIARDPKFGRAYAARALIYALLPEYTDFPPADALAQTRALATKALSLDSTFAEAHTALGLALVHAWDFTGAKFEYQKALSLDPRFFTAHQWYGELLYHTGQVDSSVAELRRTAELDPLAPIAAAALGYALTAARHYPDAVTELKKGIELAPNLGLLHSLIAEAYVFNGDRASALREMETAVKLDPELFGRQGQLAYIHAKVGDRAKALEILQKMKSDPSAERKHPVTFALAEIGVGMLDEAMTDLELAVSEHDIGLITGGSPLVDPMFDPLRSDPRFTRVLAGMHLPVRTLPRSSRLKL